VDFHGPNCKNRDSPIYCDSSRTRSRGAMRSNSSRRRSRDRPSGLCSWARRDLHLAARHADAAARGRADDSQGAKLQRFATADLLVVAPLCAGSPAMNCRSVRDHSLALRAPLDDHHFEPSATRVGSAVQRRCTPRACCNGPHSTTRTHRKRRQFLARPTAKQRPRGNA
jgi:hypothetical protein